MPDDPLDKSISVSAELTSSGIKAKAQSRTVAALDRLVGSALDIVGVKMERVPAVERAKVEAEIKVIQATGDLLAGQIGKEEALTQRALHKYFQNIVRVQENKEAVAHIAIEDLRNTPPTEEEAHSGDSYIDPEFIDRLESYAESASTDELREKWGRVLAAEIRQPGIFSNKVLRVVDEIGRETAEAFTEFCKCRIDDIVPICLQGKLDFPIVAALTTSELVVEPGLGQASMFSEWEYKGELYWSSAFGDLAISFNREYGVKFQVKYDSDILIENNGPAIRVYVLTDVGFAISKILPSNEEAVVWQLRDKLAAELAPQSVYVHKRHGAEWRRLSEESGEPMMPVVEEGSAEADIRSD